MSKRTIVTGVDVGTYTVRVVICELVKGSAFPKILGTGYSESRGLRHGYITSTSDVSRSIAQALARAEKMAGVRVRRAFISVGGIGVEGVTLTGSSIVSRADGEVSLLDVEKAITSAEEQIPELPNKKIIHSIPIAYKLDGKPVLGRPQGMQGVKVEVKALFITTLAQHVNDLISAAEDAGLEIEDVSAAPIAASFVTLTKQQKIAGCVLANIGAETVSVVVFENNTPVSLKVFPIGSTDITNDLALGLKVSLDEAEQIKLGGYIGAYPKKKVDEIMEARVSDIFDLIEDHLAKIGRNGLLPAGVIITGGGSGILSIEDIAKARLKLPSRIAELHYGPRARSHDPKERPREVFRNAPAWAVAYGLCILGFNTEQEPTLSFKKFRGMGEKVASFFKQFLP